MTKKFLEARQILLKECETYMQHNQQELNHLKAQAHYYPPIFDDVFLGEDEPYPGFHDWVCCEYYYLLGAILGSFDETRGRSIYQYFTDNRYKPSSERYTFEEIRWWHDEYRNPAPDQNQPEIVLHNLNAILNVLNFHMERQVPELAQQKIQCNYQENDLQMLGDAPLSVRIYKTLENLQLSANFSRSILATNCQLDELYNVCSALEHDVPVFEGYIKNVAVHELRMTLINPDLDDKEAIKHVENQLRNHQTIELLQKNRQSNNEKELKLLSIISIFIGIGIFTTLVLACKRLYDSGGISINFFKPLSQNLYEDLTQKLNDVAESADWLVSGTIEP